MAEWVQDEIDYDPDEDYYWDDLEDQEPEEDPYGSESE
jgi:hypothetical protein